MVMQTGRDKNLYNAVNREYGLAVILKGIDAVRYEAEQIGNSFRNIIFGVCGVRKAEIRWADICRQAKGGVKNGEK